jgi:hypothetical protein
MSIILLNWIAMMVSFAAAMYVDGFKLKLINFACGILNMVFILAHYSLV